MDTVTKFYRLNRNDFHFDYDSKWETLSANVEAMLRQCCGNCRFRNGCGSGEMIKCSVNNEMAGTARECVDLVPKIDHVE